MHVVAATDNTHWFPMCMHGQLNACEFQYKLSQRTGVFFCSGNTVILLTDSEDRCQTSCRDDSEDRCLPPREMIQRTDACLPKMIQKTDACLPETIQKTETRLLERGFRRQMPTSQREDSEDRCPPARERIHKTDAHLPQRGFTRQTPAS